ncbi:unnamed protein product [Rhizophagus irregularis]|nr:unnamed protein product [Rhizophagus irregularis]
MSNKAAYQKFFNLHILKKFLINLSVLSKTLMNSFLIRILTILKKKRILRFKILFNNVKFKARPFDKLQKGVNDIKTSYESDYQ